MEMVGMEAPLTNIDISKGIEDLIQSGVEDIKSWNKEKIFDAQEFKEILTKTEEWDLLDAETRSFILNAVNDNAIQKIFKSIILTHTIGGAATWVVAGSGVLELISRFSNGEISIQTLLTSRTIYLYISKLIGTALIPYLVWRKDQVKNKILKSATNGIPLLGSWAFPVVALWDHKKLFKFWKIYGETKESYRNIFQESETETQTLIFKEKLTRLCQEKFRQ